MRLLQHAIYPDGAIEAIYAGGADGDRFWIDDEAGLASEVIPLREVFGRDLAIDLINASDNAAPAWGVAPPDPAGLLSLDLHPSRREGEERWRLQGSRRREVRLSHRDLFTGRRTPLQGGVDYRLRLACAAAPPGAVMSVDLFDGDERTVLSNTQALGDAGTFEVSFTAPARTGEMEIGVRVPAGSTGPDLILGRPALFAASASLGEDLVPVRLRRQVLAALRGLPQGEQVSRIRAPLPPHLCDGEPHHLSLQIQSSAVLLRQDDLEYRRRPTLEVLKSGLERASLVRVVARLADRAQRYLRLQLCIDGRHGPVQTFKADRSGKVDARIAVPAEQLDGRLHWIEARCADTQAVVFQVNERTAAFHARWAVLQQWSQPPLSPESAPALPHHLRALSEWARRRSAGEAIPDVLTLHQELLAGIRKRPSYPSLGFPPVTRPRVSVVMPAHNKFEVTYAGMCGLLFAPNQTPFEVILVDDGSSDETARIEQIVSGLTVIHRPAGEGFVAACNEGAAQARGEFICFLNNDTEVTAGWLDELLRPFGDMPSVGLTGAKLIYPDGKLQEAGGIVWGTGDPWNAGRGGDADAPMWNYRREVDYLSGAAILTPREIWEELGGFGAEWAPAYFEDTDYAMKVRDSGRRVIYAPTSEVYHFEGQTAGVDKAEGVKATQELNRPKFKAKWPHIYGKNGSVVGHRPDLEKDRGVLLRALLVVDHVRRSRDIAQLVQSLQDRACKVTLLGLDLECPSDISTWSRLGVEIAYAPYVQDVTAYLNLTSSDTDLIISFGRAGRYLARSTIPKRPTPSIYSASLQHDGVSLTPIGVTLPSESEALKDVVASLDRLKLLAS